MNGIFCIIGAGDMTETKLVIPEGAYIIAADAGLNYLHNAGISPDLTVGDFDSLGELPIGGNIVVHSPDKDDTDMLLAVKEALARGAKRLIIYGGTGGRPDHEYANIQTLAYIAKHGARGYLVGRGCVCTAVKDGGLAFDDGMSGIISVFCHGSEAFGVDLVGLKYSLSNHILTSDYPLGVSNEFIGVPASISVRDGILVLMWSAAEAELDRYSEY